MLNTQNSEINKIRGFQKTSDVFFNETNFSFLFQSTLIPSFQERIDNHETNEDVIINRYLNLN